MVAACHLGYTKIVITLQPTDAMFGYTEVQLRSQKCYAERVPNEAAECSAYQIIY